MSIYKLMATWLKEAKVTPLESHLAFVALQIQGLSGAYKFIQFIKASHGG